MSHDFDVMILAAHPDDAEIACAGTTLRLLQADKQVAIVDMTRGEKGSQGNPDIRTRECAAATAMMGLGERTNLELPDTELVDDATALAAVVAEIRRLRPHLLFAQHPTDVHPDHVATGLVARRAFFHAGLRKFRPDLGEPFRPALLITYPGNDHVEPSFCIDISEFAAQKRSIIECYASQVNPDDRSHFAKRLDPLARVMARDRYAGARVGCEAAEPFVVEGPLLLTDLSCFFDR